MIILFFLNCVNKYQTFNVLMNIDKILSYMPVTI